MTSFSELQRDGMECERTHRLRGAAAAPRSWVGRCLDDTRGPVVAATDYVRGVADAIRAWVPRR